MTGQIDATIDTVRPARAMHVRGDIRCSIVDSAWGFTALRPEWNALLRASAAASPFLTWEWMHAWWRHLRGTSTLRVIAVRAGAELIALAPFCLTPNGPARLPCLDLLGTGVAGSDYLDVIIRRDWEAQSLDAIERFVRSEQLTLRLTHVRPSAAAERLATRLSEEGWTRVAIAGGTCPFIPLAGHTWDSYLGTLGASHRANVRRRIRALEQKFDVRFERVTTDAQRREALAALIRHHDRRFDQRGTAFGTAEARAFHDEVTRRALDGGWLRMLVLRLDDAVAAVMYGFYFEHTFYFYQHGFDDRYQQHSIGLVLMGLSIASAITEGAGEFDMLWGVEPYKFLWAREKRELRNLHLFPATFTGRVQRVAFHARRGVGTFIRRRGIRRRTDAQAPVNQPNVP